MVIERSEFREITALALPEEGQFRASIQAINKFQQIVHANLVKDQDYGVIPGTSKPTLLKPGAEKIAKLLGLADEYIVVDRQEDWQKPFFHYLIKCQLRHIASGVVVSEGLGECNSLESKYRWRWVKEDDLPKGMDRASLVSEVRHAKTGGHWTVYRLENDDIYSQVNTILKMSKKRALVDAALSAGRLSNVFTQDIEDFDKPPVETHTAPPQEAQSEHWCAIHKVNFFKKGQMRGYAHQIGDTKEWCNENTTSQPQAGAEEELFPEEKTTAKPQKWQTWGQVAAYASNEKVAAGAVFADAEKVFGLEKGEIRSWIGLEAAWKIKPQGEDVLIWAVAIIDGLKVH